MTEAWRSIGRHFCDVCKCWMTDNKPSREFHENGNRHKNNVRLQMQEIRQRAVEEEREQRETQKCMDEMNQAAYHSLVSDLAANPEMAARFGIEMTGLAEAHQKQQQKHREAGGQSSEESADQSAQLEAIRAKEWRAATTPEGQTYYWNCVTKETSWQRPIGFAEHNQGQHQLQQQQQPITSQHNGAELSTAANQRKRTAVVWNANRGNKQDTNVKDAHKKEKDKESQEDSTEKKKCKTTIVYGEAEAARIKAEEEAKRKSELEGEGSAAREIGPWIPVVRQSGDTITTDNNPNLLLGLPESAAQPNKSGDCVTKRTSVISQYPKRPLTQNVSSTSSSSSLAGAQQQNSSQPIVFERKIVSSSIKSNVRRTARSNDDDD